MPVRPSRLAPPALVALLVLVLGVAALAPTTASAATTVDASKRGLVGSPCTDAGASEVDFSSAVVADFSGDGRADLLLACGSYSRPRQAKLVVLIRNAANTGFGAGQLLRAAKNADRHCRVDPLAADVNGDGRADILDSCTSQVYIAKLGGAFATGYEVAKPGFCEDAAVADVTGDAAPELVSTCAGVDAVVFAGGGAKPYTSAPTKLANAPETAAPYKDGEGCDTSWSSGARVNDENGDGILDVVVVCLIAPQSEFTDDGDERTHAPRFVVVTYLRQATGSYTTTATVLQVPTKDSYCDVRIGELGSDPRTDVAIGCELIKVGSAPEAGALVVFDSVAGGGYDVQQLAHPKPVRGGKCTNQLAGSPANESGFADISGDGSPDVLMSCRSQKTGGKRGAGAAAVFSRAATTGPFTGTNVPLPSIEDASCSGPMSWADLNADAKSDIVVSCNNAKVGAMPWAGEVYVFRGGAPLTAASRQLLRPTTPVQSGWFGVTIATGNIDGAPGDELVLGAQRVNGLLEVIGAHGNGPTLPAIPASKVRVDGTKLSQLTRTGKLAVTVPTSAAGLRIECILDVPAATAKRMGVQVGSLATYPMVTGTLAKGRAGANTVRISSFGGADDFTKVTKQAFPSGFTATLRVRVTRADGAFSVAKVPVAFRW